MHTYRNPLIRSISSITFSFPQRRFYAEKKSALNHYNVLGVNSDASMKDIKAAFYRLSKKYHPDVNADDMNAATKFTTISDAYDVLNDPIKRREYDTELLFRRSTADPFVTYNRSDEYAQRARAHRASAWRSTSGSDSFHRGFSYENTFRNSRSTKHGSFYQEQYDSAFGRYRDQANDSNHEEQSNTEPPEEDYYEESSEEKEKTTLVSKLILFSLCLSYGLTAFLTSTLFLAMHFEQPTEEFSPRLVTFSKSSRYSSSKF